MKHDDIRFGVIAHLVREMAGRPPQVGKTFLQKLVYFLESSGVSIGYRYEMYHYGPYSFDLANDLEITHMIDIIDFQEDEWEYGYEAHEGSRANEYLEKKDCKAFIKKYGKLISKVVRYFENSDLRDIELKSTVHFVNEILRERGINGVSKVVQEVKELKPRFLPKEIRRAYISLEEVGFIE